MRGKKTGRPRSIPEHEVHELKALALQEALTIGAEHQAGAERVKQVLHHLLLLRCTGIVSFKHLSSNKNRKEPSTNAVPSTTMLQFPKPACHENPKETELYSEALFRFQFRETKFSDLWALNAYMPVHIKTLNT